MNMDANYNFNAPQPSMLLDIQDDANIDSFFDYINNEIVEEVEDGRKQTKEICRRTTFNVDDKENVRQNDKYTLDQRLKTPIVNKINSNEFRSNDEKKILEQLSNLQINNSNMTPFKSNRKTFNSTEKVHKMMTRQDVINRTPLLQLRSRSIVRITESDDETDDSMVSAVSSSSQTMESLSPRRQLAPAPNKKRNSEVLKDAESISLQPSKFVALAEMVANFHNETPDRFRSKPHKIWRPSMMKPPLLGVPKGPSLTTLSRNRSVFYPTKEEREQQEYEEMLKHQIKAHPINEKILKEKSLGLKVPIVKRPSTCPIPFKLTERVKPKTIVEEPVFRFKAQPVPTKILQSPVGIPPRKVIAATTPKTPAITQPIKCRVDFSVQKQLSQGAGGSTESLPKNTKIQPFSFEERDKAMLARKQEFVKRILEEEKKACNSFVAKPVRKVIMKGSTPLKCQSEPKKTIPQPFNLTNPKKHDEQSSSEMNVKPFKATPAIVLQRRPFYPRHDAPTPLKVQAFDFKTDSRLIEREAFEEKRKKREEEAKMQEDKIRQDAENKAMENLKELRKMAEFKANPIPKHKPFKIEESKISLTQPISPHFRSGKQMKSTSA